jgi:hypothetical protein
LTLGFNQFISTVETVQAGTYLGHFLKSDINGVKRGWEFTRSVARSLSQFQSGKISWGELQILPGFRPGFWKELRAHIELAPVDPTKTQQKSTPLPTPDPLSDQKTFFGADLPEALLEALATTDRRFDAVIVDEGQDFDSLWWISILELLKNPNDDPLYIFYDDNQHIYSTNLAFPIKEEPFLLCENCRNTRQIHEEVMKNYRGNLETTCLGPDGRTPQIIVVSGDQEERDTLSGVINRLVKQEQVPVTAITILTPKAQGKSKWRDGERLGGFAVTWEARANGQSIRCSTIHAFKGLESPVIILTEMTESDQTRLRQLTYVGSSRAKSHLVCVHRSQTKSSTPSNPTR